LVRSEERAAPLRALGTPNVAVGMVDVARAGPFDIILDSVGGDTLTDALALLAPKGRCIAFGVTGGRAVGFDAFDFYQKQQRVEGFGLFPTIAGGKTIREGLGRLLALVEQQRLHVMI